MKSSTDLSLKRALIRYFTASFSSNFEKNLSAQSGNLVEYSIKVK